MQVSNIGEPLLKIENKGWTITAKNLQSFCRNLENIVFCEVYTLADPIASFETFMNEVNQQMLLCFKNKKPKKTKLRFNGMIRSYLLCLGKKINFIGDF